MAAGLPKGSISGITIYTGGFDAEYGNALSGIVNVITKSGGNNHKFAARLDKDNWLPERWNKQQDRLTEVELSASGPVLPDRLFYFTSNSLLTTDTRWWRDFQFYFLSPVSQELSGFSKVEYLHMPTMRLALQAIYSLKEWHDYEFSWRYNLSGLPPRARYAVRGAAIFTHTISANTYYTLSLSTFYNNSKIGEGGKEQMSLQSYQYDFFLRYIVEGNRNWWADTRQTIFTLKGELTTHIANMHTVKAGAEINQYSISSDLVKYEPQTTYFGKPIQEAPLLNYSNTYRYFPRSGSVFIQDKVELVREGSNLSFGLRWDFLDPTAERPLIEYIPVAQNEYQQKIAGTIRARLKHQLSPRLSIAAPAGPSSFFFLNYGHYFQYPLFDYLYSGINPAQLRGGARSVVAGNPDLEPERSIALEVGFKHSIDEHVIGSVTYFRKAFKNQVDSKTLVPFDSKFAGDYGFASYVNNSEASATGLEFVLSREQDEKLSGSISYTYMITEGLTETVNQQINLAQWGFPVAVRPYPLSWDQRHTLKGDGEFVLPGGIFADVVLLYNSPRPFTYYPTRDGFSPVDTTKVFLPNNSRMSSVALVNIKLTKRFEVGANNRYVLTLYADGKNILNAKNVRWMDSNRRIGGELSDPSAYYDFRRVRVGVKVEF
jgi:outer membrane receptor protein involved in Fe transport